MNKQTISKRRKQIVRDQAQQGEVFKPIPSYEGYVAGNKGTILREAHQTTKHGNGLIYPQTIGPQTMLPFDCERGQ